MFSITYFETYRLHLSIWNSYLMESNLQFFLMDSRPTTAIALTHLVLHYTIGIQCYEEKNQFPFHPQWKNPSDSLHTPYHDDRWDRPNRVKPTAPLTDFRFLFVSHSIASLRTPNSPVQPTSELRNGSRVGAGRVVAAFFPLSCFHPHIQMTRWNSIIGPLSETNRMLHFASECILGCCCRRYRLRYVIW